MTGEYEKIVPLPAEMRLDDQIGPAAHLTRGKADAMIEGALLAAGFGHRDADEVANDVEIELAQEPAATQPRRKRPVAFWQAVAAAVVAFFGIGSASAAVMWFAKQSSRPTVEQLQEPAAKPHKQKRVATLKPRGEPLPIEEAAPAVADVVEPSVVAKPKHVRERKPEDWLEEANQLRARKRWKDADEAYAKVWQTAPNSDAAYVARIAAAGVRLDHLGDARTALIRYRAALKASARGALNEEARFGIAEAYRKLDDTDREIKALRTFLAKHPEAGLAPKARARLSTLGQAL